MADKKRRLVVLKEDDEAELRPRWQWIGFGAFAVFLAWLPLAWLAEALKRATLTRIVGAVTDEAPLGEALSTLAGGERAVVVFVTVALPLLAMAAGGFAGGFLVGRYGGEARAREAALAGALAGVLAAGLTWQKDGFSLGAFVAVALLAGAAFLGGRRGLRKR